MLGFLKKLFSGKSELEKLQDQYKSLLAEAHSLSTVNRTASEAKLAEANEVLRQIDALSASNN